jgi:hypothetical protein
MALMNMHRPAALAIAAVLGAGVLVAPEREARADDVASSGKGIAGGALLGAELPTIIEGIAGVRPTWIYIVSAVVGAGGGGFGGYEIEKNSTDGKAPMYMLAGGLALVIPAMVLTLNATRYQPEEGATEDRTPVGPAAEPGTPGGSITGTPGGAASPTPAPPTPPPAAPPPAAAPPPQSLLDFRIHPGQASGGGQAGSVFRVGVPAVEVRQGMSLKEAALYGVKDTGAAVHMPVLHVAF